MTIIFSLLFAAIFAGLYFWSKGRAEPVNRYHRKKTIPRVDGHSDNQPHYFSNTDRVIKGDVFAESSHDEKVTPTISTPKQPPVTKPDCVVALYLMSPDDAPYTGYELMQALLSAGLRYGDHRIFHRHVHKDGRGAVLFHCASAAAPGTFDLTKIGSFSCKGLSLFFSSSDVSEPLATFDCLLETLDQLVEDLGGKVLDEKRMLLTKDRMLKYRQQIRAFETSKSTVDLFA